MTTQLGITLALWFSSPTPGSEGRHFPTLPGPLSILVRLVNIDVEIEGKFELITHWNDVAARHL